MALPSYAMEQASFPAMYERELVGPLFRPFAELTLDELRPAAGDRLLDIACGTGIIARLAIERLGSGAGIVGVDVSRDMLAVARELAPDVDWREGDAADLPLKAGERFDVVVCQQGLQFVADRKAAAREMRRALVEGGRLAVSTWRSDEEIPFFRELRLAAERHLGPIDDQRYGFGDGEGLARLLMDAGFGDVRVSTVERTIRMPDGPTLVRLNAMALIGMSSGGMALGEDQRRGILQTIVEESASVLDGYSSGSGIAFSITTNLATAGV